MLFHLHHINGKLHCEHSYQDCRRRVDLQKRHRRRQMMYEGVEGLSHFIGADLNHYPL